MYISQKPELFLKFFFMFHALIQYIKFLKRPTNALEYTNVSLLYSNHRQKAWVHQDHKGSNQMFINQSVSQSTTDIFQPLVTIFSMAGTRIQSPQLYDLS